MMMKGLPRRVGFIYSTKQALHIVSSLSQPGKMPCFAYSIPASHCKTGQILSDIEGTSCSKCYAQRGWYPKREPDLEKRFQALQHPEWTDAMIFLIRSHEMDFFRWHDSGDLQGMWHLEKILEVVRQTPQTKHWLATIEIPLIQEYWRNNGRIPISELFPNLTVRLSSVFIEETIPKTFAKLMGVQTSAVSRTNHNCPAYKQTYIEHGKEVYGSCGDCRKCWDQNETTVIYKLHGKKLGRPKKNA